MQKLDYIWSINEQKLSPIRRWMLRVTRRAVIVYERITQKNIMNYASSLTYNTMLSAVPVLAIVFAIARGFGFGTLFEDKIRYSLKENPDFADTLLNFVDSYLDHTQGGVFIGAGLIFLLYTLISLTSNIELAFNTIWSVPNSRNIYRKITDFISVFLLIPIVFVIVSGVNIFLMTYKSVWMNYQFIGDTLENIIRIFPIVLISFAFILLYILMPNTKVKVRHTIVPGILAGISFWVVQYFYVHYQIKLSAYNAIYGSFAALPLLTIWINISWCICLIGGQMCYANQYLQNYSFVRNSEEASRRYRDTIGLLLICKICKRFKAGSVPYSSRTLADDTQLPETIVRNVLDKLVEVQLLAETRDANGSDPHYLPAVDVQLMTVQLVVSRLDSFGTENRLRAWHPCNKEWETLRKLRMNGEDALLVDIE